MGAVLDGGNGRRGEGSDAVSGAPGDAVFDVGDGRFVVEVVEFIKRQFNGAAVDRQGGAAGVAIEVGPGGKRDGGVAVGVAISFRGGLIVGRVDFWGEFQVAGLRRVCGGGAGGVVRAEASAIKDVIAAGPGLRGAIVNQGGGIADVETNIVC